MLSSSESSFQYQDFYQRSMISWKVPFHPAFKHKGDLFTKSVNCLTCNSVLNNIRTLLLTIDTASSPLIPKNLFSWSLHKFFNRLDDTSFIPKTLNSVSTNTLIWTKFRVDLTNIIEIIELFARESILNNNSKHVTERLREVNMLINIPIEIEKDSQQMIDSYTLMHSRIDELVKTAKIMERDAINSEEDALHEFFVHNYIINPIVYRYHIKRSTTQYNINQYYTEQMIEKLQDDMDQMRYKINTTNLGANTMQEFTMFQTMYIQEKIAFASYKLDEEMTQHDYVTQMLVSELQKIKETFAAKRALLALYRKEKVNYEAKLLARNEAKEREAEELKALLEKLKKKRPKRKSKKPETIKKTSKKKRK